MRLIVEDARKWSWNGHSASVRRSEQKETELLNEERRVIRKMKDEDE